MAFNSQKDQKNLLKRAKKDLRQKKEAEAEHRRRILASLDPKTREMAQRDFAKLGLYQ